MTSVGEKEKRLIADYKTSTPYGLDESLPNDERGILHIEGANYWAFYDLEYVLSCLVLSYLICLYMNLANHKMHRLINGPYGIYARDASHNLYSGLSTHDNYESGFQLQGESSNNTVENLDSYLNRDPRKNGESADGFACKEGSGAGNVLRNARLWDNVDDGLDLYEFAGAVTLEQVYSWGNGFNRWGFSSFEGDGNGFKLGIEGGPAAPHVVRQSIAFANAKKGFIDNGNTGALTFERNTAWANGDNGFNMRSSTSELSANVAAANANADVSLVDSVTSSGNSWDGDGTWSNASFVSVDYEILAGPRGSDGRVQASDFLLPVSGEEIGAST